MPWASQDTSFPLTTLLLLSPHHAVACLSLYLSGSVSASGRAGSGSGCLPRGKDSPEALTESTAALGWEGSLGFFAQVGTCLSQTCHLPLPLGPGCSQDVCSPAHRAQPCQERPASLSSSLSSVGAHFASPGSSSPLPSLVSSSYGFRGAASTP